VSGGTTPAKDLPDLFAECGIFPPKLAHPLALAYRALLAEIARQRAAEAALQGLLARGEPGDRRVSILVAQARAIGDALLAELQRTEPAGGT